MTYVKRRTSTKLSWITLLAQKLMFSHCSEYLVHVRGASLSHQPSKHSRTANCCGCALPPMLCHYVSEKDEAGHFTGLLPGNFNQNHDKGSAESMKESVSFQGQQTPIGEAPQIQQSSLDHKQDLAFIGAWADDWLDWSPMSTSDVSLDETEES